MTENREQKHDGYALHTAEVILGLRSRPALTKREQALEDTKVIVAMLRRKTDGGSLPDETRPPGPPLKNDLAISGSPNSTDEKNNSSKSEDPSVEKNNFQNSVEGTALSGTLKLISSFVEIPVENSP